MIEEVWRDIPGFTGYQVSNMGEVRTFRKRKHYPEGYGSFFYISDTPNLVPQSDDGNGYLKVCLYGDDGKNHCVKVHRLVAESFLDHESQDDTVDHICSGPAGKLNNSVENLRWISRRENVKKAYLDGIHDSRIRMSRKTVCVFDTYSGEELYFESVEDAADYLDLHYTSLSHVANKGIMLKRRFYVDYIYGEDRLLYLDPGMEDCYD